MEENQDNLNHEASVQTGIDKVYQAMVNWEADRNNLTDVSDYFSQGNCFEFTINMGSSPYLHAYPSVDNGVLVYQVITSDNDVMSNFSALTPPPNVITGTVGTKTVPGLGGEIDKTTALRRIGNWADETTRDEWMLAETTNSNMYQCFVIPGDDIVSNVKHTAFFALRAGEEDDYIADLIIVNMATNEIVGQKVESGTVYYDMTRPVPPYKVSDGRAKVNFGLLNYIELL